VAGLECWLTGSRAELDAALTALAAQFIVVNRSALEPLPAIGAGGRRYRRYVRAHLRTTEPGRDPSTDQGRLFDAVATTGPALSTPRQHEEGS
jgi:hypothetical protein